MTKNQLKTYLQHLQVPPKHDGDILKKHLRHAAASPSFENAYLVKEYLQQSALTENRR